jgi:hypothetical protein
VLYTHTVCDGPITERLTCSTCGEVHDRRQVYVCPGRGMPVDIAEQMRSAPYRPDRTDDAG